MDLTTQSKPEAATHWSTRKMGAVPGVSASTVVRHWQANGLKPHAGAGPHAAALAAEEGRAQTMTHDYKRHGTTTQFAALSVLDEQVIGQCQQRHTHAELPKSLR